MSVSRDTKEICQEVGKLPGIVGFLTELKAMELRLALAAALQQELWPDVVVNRTIHEGMTAGTTVSVNSSLNTDPAEVQLVIDTIEKCGITVQRFSRTIISPVPKIYSFGGVLIEEYQQILTESGIVNYMQPIPSEVLNLLGEKAPYLSAYCYCDSELQRIADALSGKADIEVNYAEGMRFYPKAPAP